MKALKMTLIAALFLFLLVFLRPVALGRVTAEQYFNKGNAASDKHLYGEAISNHSKVIELKPKYQAKSQNAVFQLTITDGMA